MTSGGALSDGGEAGAVMTADAAEFEVADPAALLAVTVTRTVAPTAALVTENVGASGC